MNHLLRMYPFVAAHLAWVAVIPCAFGFSVFICIRYLETEERRAQRIQRKKDREIKTLTHRISAYARDVHKRFPGGHVVVGEKDLAEQLRKHPDLVAIALNVLLGERKVQKAPLDGYWKLNA
jgi:hypothetical protein